MQREYGIDTYKGYKWIVRFAPVTAKYVRLRIEDGRGCPAIHTFGVYKQSEILK